MSKDSLTEIDPSVFPVDYPLQAKGNIFQRLVAWFQPHMIMVHFYNACCKMVP